MLYELLFGLFPTRLLVGWGGVGWRGILLQTQVHGGVSNAIIFLFTSSHNPSDDFPSYFLDHDH